jgi:hypothetical protein
MLLPGIRSGNGKRLQPEDERDDGGPKHQAEEHSVSRADGGI